MHILTLDFFWECMFSVSSLKWHHWLSSRWHPWCWWWGLVRPDSAEATVHIMNEFIGSMSLGQPKKWGEGAENGMPARHDWTCINKHNFLHPWISNGTYRCCFIQCIEFVAFFLYFKILWVFLAVFGAASSAIHWGSRISAIAQVPFIWNNTSNQGFLRLTFGFADFRL